MSADYKQQLAANYKKDAVATASPGRLVLMLYDGALKFLKIAQQGFETEKMPDRNELINNNLIKTQNILSELQGSLDMNVPGEFPRTMFRLYDFMIRQLQQANIRKNREPVTTVQRLLQDLRDGWEDMLRKTDDGRNARDGEITPSSSSDDQTEDAAAVNKSDGSGVGGGLDASA